jgi:hypothetical protein
MGQCFSPRSRSLPGGPKRSAPGSRPGRGLPPLDLSKGICETNPFLGSENHPQPRVASFQPHDGPDLFASIEVVARVRRDEPQESHSGNGLPCWETLQPILPNKPISRTRSPSPTRSYLVISIGHPSVFSAFAKWRCRVSTGPPGSRPRSARPGWKSTRANLPNEPNSRNRTSFSTSGYIISISARPQ